MKEKVERAKNKHTNLIEKRGRLLGMENRQTETKLSRLRVKFCSEEEKVSAECCYHNSVEHSLVSEKVEEQGQPPPPLPLPHHLQHAILGF